MSSPIKLDFSEKADRAPKDCPRHKMFKELVVSLFPARDIVVIKSKLKPPKFPVWDRDCVSVYDHLVDLRSVAEDNIRLGYMEHDAEFYASLLTSVRIPSMRAWLQQHEPACERDASLLMYALLRAFHNVHDERICMDGLEALPVMQDVEALNQKFNELSVRVSKDLLTDKGRALLYLKKVPMNVRSVGMLDTKLDEGGFSLVHLQFEALRISRQPGVESVFAPPAPPVLSPPVPPGSAGLSPASVGSTAPAFDANMDVDELTGRGGRGRSGGRGRGRGNGNGRGRGGRGGKGLTCFRCHGWGHVVADCPTPATDAN
jgi:hypothetical protein